MKFSIISSRFISFLIAFILGSVSGIFSAEKKITVKRSAVKTKTSKSNSVFEKGDSIYRVKINEAVSIILENGDKALFSTDSISFAGYDKQLNSTKESILVINKSLANIRVVNFKITYRDMTGRMLHSRNVTAYCNVPPLETRKIDFQSWDTQNSFYYHLSGKPRRNAAPYKIELTPQSCSIVIPRNDQ